jgi:peroxiredoxin
MTTVGFIRTLFLALALAVMPGIASALEVGDKAPDFNLASTKEGKWSLAAQAGKKNVVIQFYVLDFTPT